MQKFPLASQQALAATPVRSSMTTTGSTGEAREPKYIDGPFALRFRPPDDESVLSISSSEVDRALTILSRNPQYEVLAAYVKSCRALAVKPDRRVAQSLSALSFQDVSWTIRGSGTQEGHDGSRGVEFILAEIAGQSRGANTSSSHATNAKCQQNVSQQPSNRRSLLALVCVIVQNPKIRHLVLQDLNICARDLPLIFSALSRLTELTELDLSYNPLVPPIQYLRASLGQQASVDALQTICRRRSAFVRKMIQQAISQNPSLCTVRVKARGLIAGKFQPHADEQSQAIVQLKPPTAWGGQRPFSPSAPDILGSGTLEVVGKGSEKASIKPGASVKQELVKALIEHPTALAKPIEMSAFQGSLSFAAAGSSILQPSSRTTKSLSSPHNRADTTMLPLGSHLPCTPGALSLPTRHANGLMPIDKALHIHKAIHRRASRPGTDPANKESLNDKTTTNQRGSKDSPRRSGPNEVNEGESEFEFDDDDDDLLFAEDGWLEVVPGKPANQFILRLLASDSSNIWIQAASGAVAKAYGHGVPRVFLTDAEAIQYLNEPCDQIDPDIFFDEGHEPHDPFALTESYQEKRRREIAEQMQEASTNVRNRDVDLNAFDPSAFLRKLDLTLKNSSRIRSAESSARVITGIAPSAELDAVTILKSKSGSQSEDGSTRFTSPTPRNVRAHDQSFAIPYRNESVWKAPPGSSGVSLAGPILPRIAPKGWNFTPRTNTLQDLDVPDWMRPVLDHEMTGNQILESARSLDPSAFLTTAKQSRNSIAPFDFDPYTVKFVLGQQKSAVISTSPAAPEPQLSQTAPEKKEDASQHAFTTVSETELFDPVKYAKERALKGQRAVVDTVLQLDKPPTGAPHGQDTLVNTSIQPRITAQAISYDDLMKWITLGDRNSRVEEIMKPMSR